MFYLHILSKEDLSSALDKALTHLKAQAENGTLLENDIFDVYIYLWKDGKGLEEPKEYLRGLLTPESLQSLIKAYKDRSTLAYDKGIDVGIEGQEQTGLRLGLLLEDFDLLNEANGVVNELLAADPPVLGQDEQTSVEALQRYLSQKQERSNDAED